MTYTPSVLHHLRRLDARYQAEVHRAKAALHKACPELSSPSGPGDEDAQKRAQLDLSLAVLCRGRVQEHLARAAMERQGGTTA